jgi:hypothetical protein
LGCDQAREDADDGEKPFHSPIAAEIARNFKAIWACRPTNRHSKPAADENHRDQADKEVGGAWSAYEAPGVSPCYPGPTGKQFAIDYARNSRFGGTSGEIRVYDETGENLIEVITVQGHRAFGV